MIFYVGLLYILLRINVITGLDIYSGLTACNKTIYLDSKVYAGFLNFSDKPGHPVTFSGTMTCSISLQSWNGHFIVVKFFPLHLNSTDIKRDRPYRQNISITSQGNNIPVNNTFPDYEVLSRKFIDLKYEIHNVSKVTDYSQIEYFDILFYTFYFMNTKTNSCARSDTLCADSFRCLPEPLACLQTYDFCANGFRNCKPITMEPPETTTIIETYNVSYNGVFIFIGCVVFLLSIMVYMCFCRSIVAYCKYSCPCTPNRHGVHAPRVRQPRDQPEPEEQEAESHDVMINNPNEANTAEVEDIDSNTNDGVQFGLPPSYSYLEQNESLVDPRYEACTCMSDRTSASLPPSYSTVLNHEEEYRVHVY